MKQIFLIRHCKAIGQEPDAQLTEEGKIQANFLNDFLADHSIDHIISSPFLRAVVSITPFARNQNLEIHIDNRLSERILSSEDLVDWMPLLRESFDDLDRKLPGGESSREAMMRGISAIQDILKNSYQYVAVVTHGNLLSLILKHYDDHFGFEEWQSLTNPDVYVLRIHDENIEIDRIWS